MVEINHVQPLKPMPMKWLKLLLPAAGIMLSACTTTVITDDPYYEVTTAADVLLGKDLWYIDIDETIGNESANFMQIAFTLSFDNGHLRANNNLTALGNLGSGMGMEIGSYAFSGNLLKVYHDIDGLKDMRIEVVNAHKVRLTDIYTGTSYALYGYYLDEFDYEALFYDNLHYFLQEYTLWEKTYTSTYGALNDFDQENFLNFSNSGGDLLFQSSIDKPGTSPGQVYWDYQGVYTVYQVAGEPYLKTLTLDYDYLGNDYFEISVLDKATIELFHPASGTVYVFKGRYPLQYLRPAGEDSLPEGGRLRIKYDIPEMKVKRLSDETSFNLI
jgi:hypothetical protein